MITCQFLHNLHLLVHDSCQLGLKNRDSLLGTLTTCLVVSRAAVVVVKAAVGVLKTVAVVWKVLWLCGRLLQWWQKLFQLCHRVFSVVLTCCRWCGAVLQELRTLCCYLALHIHPCLHLGSMHSL